MILERSGVDAAGSLFVLDVGHGNCAAIVHEGTAILVDVGPGAAILDFLSDAGVSRIESLIVSHADADHLGGLIGLLAAREVAIDHVYINADGLKHTTLWQDVAYELDDLQRAGFLTTTLGVIEGDLISCSLVGWSVEILAPRLRLAQLGVGNLDREDRRITSNSMSIVAKVLHGGSPVALLPGDIDYVGFRHLVANGSDLAAEILVLPHHGGKCGTDRQTAEVDGGLAGASRASHIVTSHGRNKHKNPLPLVVDAVRTAHPAGRLACTQMSTNCLTGGPSLGLPQVSDWPSAGSEAGISCAGTLAFSADAILKGEAAHQSMIEHHAPSRLCGNAPV